MSILVAVHTSSPPSLSSPFTFFSLQPVQSQQVVAEKEEEEEFFGSWTATFSPSMFAASQPSSLPFLFPSLLPFLSLSLLSHSTSLFYIFLPLPPCRHRSGPRTSATTGKRESQLQTTGREGQKESHTLTNLSMC